LGAHTRDRLRDGRAILRPAAAAGLAAASTSCWPSSAWWLLGRKRRWLIRLRRRKMRVHAIERSFVGGSF